MRCTPFALAAVLTVGLPAHATRAAIIGDTAEFTTLFHDVAGTVTVVDEDTFRVDDFVYDGQAPAVYFYLGVEDTQQSYVDGLQVQPLLSGMVFDGTQGPLFYDLPAGSTFDDYNGISVWCVQFSANFGSGAFSAPLMGDPTGDGFVGIDDLNLVLAVWGQTAGPGEVIDGDLSGDGFVGIDDLNAVLGNWNAGTPPTGNVSADPEPASAMTLVLLAFLGARQPRKH